MKKDVQVFEGNELKLSSPSLSANSARCFLYGTDGIGSDTKIPLSDELLSKHLLFLGGIGTGKTNAIYQIIAQLRRTMTANDVMVIFDTKGDFYKEFYRKGDVVISNDSKATGSNGTNYWNIFRELGHDASTEANIIEIARTLFFEKNSAFITAVFSKRCKGFV